MLRDHVAAEIGAIAKPKTIYLTPDLPKTRSRQDHAPPPARRGRGTQPRRHHDPGRRDRRRRAATKGESGRRRRVTPGPHQSSRDAGDRLGCPAECAPCVCERFKFGATGADERFVNDSADPGSPRVAHDPVKDSGGTPATTTSTAPPPVPAGRRTRIPTGFRFNLDDALARLSEPHQPIPRFKWSAVTSVEPSATAGSDVAADRRRSPLPPTARRSRQPPTERRRRRGSMFPDQESRARPLTQPTLDPLPEIREATHGRHPAPRPTGRPSRCCAAASRSPVLVPVPAVVTAGPWLAAPMVVTGSEAFAAGAFGFTPDSDYAPAPGRDFATAAMSTVACRGCPTPIRPPRRRWRRWCRRRPRRTPPTAGPSVGRQGPQEAQAQSLRQGGPGPVPDGRARRRGAHVRS